MDPNTTSESPQHAPRSAARKPTTHTPSRTAPHPLDKQLPLKPPLGSQTNINPLKGTLFPSSFKSMTHRGLEPGSNSLISIHMPKTYKGGCHCGAVRFEAEVDPSNPIACNCSICGKAGHWLTFTPADKFKLESGEDNLTDYQFNKKMIHHLFCKTCGIRSFGRGKGQDGTEMIAVNVRCLDGIDLDTIEPKKFNGKDL